MFRRLIAFIVCIAFSLSNFQYVQAQDFSVNQLPVPGTMVGESATFAPLSLKGLIVNPQKPLEFQFIVDTGKGPQDQASIKEEADQLIKYFLAGLTIPEGDLWVNLSPYEKNRMVPAALGQTDLGRDLLAQDYILKQLTASLIYPEKDLGKEFWNRVYSKAQQQFGTTNVPVNTFNKVWILPDQAQVYENVNAAYVTKATLKVMLDEDYLALQRHNSHPLSSPNVSVGDPNTTHTIASQIVRQIVLPEITKEVNTGKNFAPLRQIYQSLILAKWYKETIQNGLLEAVYMNKNKISGVNLNDPSVKEQIYNRYLQAYKKGAFNFIKEDPTPDGQVVPRKYFSGGITKLPGFIDHHGTQQQVESQKPDGAMISLTVRLIVARVLDTLDYLKLKLQKTPKSSIKLEKPSQIVPNPQPSSQKQSPVSGMNATSLLHSFFQRGDVDGVIAFLNNKNEKERLGAMTVLQMMAGIEGSSFKYFYASRKYDFIDYDNLERRAKEALLKFGNKELLLFLLQDSDTNIRSAARERLIQLQIGPYELTRGYLAARRAVSSEASLEAEQRLKQLNVPSAYLIEYYIFQLQHGDYKAKKFAIDKLRELGALQDKRVYDMLIDFLKNPQKNSDGVFIAIQELSKLGELKDKSIRDILLGLLNDPKTEHYFFHTEVIESFVESGDTRALQPLLSYFKTMQSKQVDRYTRFRVANELIKLDKVYKFSLEEQVRIKLATRQPDNKGSEVHGDLLDFYNKAYQYALEGYDFRVIFEPQEGKWVGAGTNETYYISKHEVFRIERGRKLSNHAMSTPNQIPNDEAMLGPINFIKLQRMKKQYGNENEDVLRKLIRRQPVEASGTILDDDTVKKAIQYKREGDDFRVHFEPKVEHNEGSYDVNGNYDLWVTDKKEQLFIERGDKLPPDAAMFGAHNNSDNIGSIINHRLGGFNGGTEFKNGTPHSSEPFYSALNSVLDQFGAAAISFIPEHLHRTTNIGDVSTHYNYDEVVGAIKILQNRGFDSQIAAEIIKRIEEKGYTTETLIALGEVHDLHAAKTLITLLYRHASKRLPIVIHYYHPEDLATFLLTSLSGLAHVNHTTLGQLFINFCEDSNNLEHIQSGMHDGQGVDIFGIAIVEAFRNASNLDLNYLLVYASILKYGVINPSAVKKLNEIIEQRKNTMPMSLYAGFRVNSFRNDLWQSKVTAEELELIKSSLNELSQYSMDARATLSVIQDLEQGVSAYPMFNGPEWTVVLFKQAEALSFDHKRFKVQQVAAKTKRVFDKVPSTVSDPQAALDSDDRSYVKMVPKEVTVEPAKLVIVPDPAMLQTQEQKPPDPAMFTKLTVLKIGMMRDATKVVLYLYDSDAIIRQAAMKRLDQLEIDEDSPYYYHSDVRLWSMNRIDRLVTDPEKKLQILTDALSLSNNLSDVLMWAMREIDRLVTDPEKKLPILINALGPYFNEAVRPWAIKEIDRLVTDPEKKLPIFMRALHGNSKIAGLWAMREIDRLVTDPEKKLPILTDALGSYFNAAVPVWAMEEIDRIAVDPEKKIPILKVALVSSGVASLWAMKEIDRLVTDPEKKLSILTDTLGDRRSHSDVRVWVEREINRMVTDPNKRLLILTLADVNSYHFTDEVRNNFDRLVTDPLKRIVRYRIILGSDENEREMPKTVEWAAHGYIVALGEIDNLTIEPQKKFAIYEEALAVVDRHRYSEIRLAVEKILGKIGGVDAIRLLNSQLKRIPNDSPTELNTISDSLHNLKQPEGDYIYSYTGIYSPCEKRLRSDRPPLRNGNYVGEIVGNYEWVYIPTHTVQVLTSYTEYPPYREVEIPEKYEWRYIAPVDYAMSHTPNVVSKVNPAANGGIDLNQINVLRGGKKVNVLFDPAQLNALEQGGFEGFSFKIESMTRISSPLQLLGINTAKQPILLAKA